MAEALHHSRSARRTAGRAQEAPVADPYQARQKAKEPSACPVCGAVYHRGRWQWAAKPDDAQDDLCPACRRIHDRFPAGVLTLHGAFARQHEGEFIALARHEEAAENRDHPLNRILAIEASNDGLTIATTDIHLPRRIGTALKRAYRGTLDMHFDKTGYFLRARWRGPE